MLIQLFRAKPAPRRLAEAFSASNRVAEQCKNAIRQRHPEFSEDEIDLRFIELNYGQKIAGEVRAYLIKK